MKARLQHSPRDVPPAAGEVAVLPRAARRRTRRFPVVLVVVLAGAGFAHAETPQELLERYNCNFCHSDNEARTGPAFSDVAARYRGNPQAVAILTATVRKGTHGSGPWHMPPHPEVSDADAATMVRYILSVRQ